MYQNEKVIYQYDNITFFFNIKNLCLKKKILKFQCLEEKYKKLARKLHYIS